MHTKIYYLIKIVNIWRCVQFVILPQNPKAINVQLFNTGIYQDFHTNNFLKTDVTYWIFYLLVFIIWKITVKKLKHKMQNAVNTVLVKH